MQSSQDPQKIILASTGAVVTGIAMNTLLKVFDKIMGDAYSVDDQDKLRELVHLHKRILKVENAPLCWDLDENKRPAYCFVAHRKYERHVAQVKENKHGVKNYNYYSWLLVESIVQYLEQRKIRLVGKGRNGDLLEQCLGEWLVWSLQELPNLEYDETSIEMLEARRDYIKAIISHANLFVQGRVKRDIEKFDIFHIIQKELNSCIKKAKEEQTRISSQKYFEICQQNTAGLLLECLKVIYYFRGEAAYKFPLFIDDYSKSNQEEKLTNIAKSLYLKIRNTHSGEMLNAIIVQAGVDSFDLITKEESDILISGYFDNEYRIKIVKWDVNKSDLPEWIKDDSSKIEQLVTIQKLCESILRLAEIKKLIVAAYALTSAVGDSWAYGDKQGKLAIKSLLFVFDNELEKLRKMFVDFYEYHSTTANRYNHLQKKNADTQSNLNFSKVSTAIADIKKLAKLLKKTSTEMKEQIDKYPQDSDTIIDGLKQYFYSSLSNFIKTYYPLREDLFSHTAVRDERFTSFYSFRFQHELDLSRELRLYELDSYLYQIRENGSGQIYCIKENSNDSLFLLAPFERKNFKAEWKIGQRYRDWHSGFFNRNKLLFTTYNELLHKELANAIRKKDVDLIQIINKRVSQCVEEIKSKIEREKPQWRLFPTTLGWPFNNVSRIFARTLVQDLTFKKQKVSQYIEATISYIRRETSSSDEREQHNNIENDARLVSSLTQEILRSEQCVSTLAANQLSQVMISQRLQRSASIVPIETTPVQAKNPNKFMEWYTAFSSQFHTWQENDFKGEFLVIDSNEKANNILKDCLAHQEKLNGKDKLFMENCSVFLSSLRCVVEDSRALITENSLNQIEVVLKLLAVLLSPISNNERQVKLTEFSQFCDEIFSGSLIVSAEDDREGELSVDERQRYRNEMKI
jgi:hypothetical protein